MYFVSTIRLHDGEYGDPRTVGFYYLFEDAERCILENHCDIFEYHYNYAVIEEIDEGVYPDVIMEMWYEWQDGKYKSVEKPKQFEHIENFSIG